MPFFDLVIIEWPMGGGAGRIWGGELFKGEVNVEVSGVAVVECDGKGCILRFWDSTWL